ncbi:hypothetical protein [Mesoterricola silvestris]|uniref:hypothetical protein n=1 Tax=Mesoterricola silvestris TaxID=2927979 RepID=UPI00292D869A|nr:hypothetical protein [Mesoterricola silvestris]
MIHPNDAFPSKLPPKLEDGVLACITGGMMHRQQAAIPGHIPSSSSAWTGPQGTTTGPVGRAILETVKSEIASETLRAGLNAAKAVGQLVAMGQSIPMSSRPVADRTHRWLN